MKTIKQIADELGLDKQKVYRYIKKNHIKEVYQECISEALQKNGVKYYDEVAESLIKQGFSDNTTSNEVHQEVHQKHINDTVIDTLLEQIREKDKQLKEKDNQIAEKDNQMAALNKRLEESHRLLDQSQQLQAMAASKIKLLEEKQEEEKAIEPAPVSEPEPEKKHWWHFWK